MLTLKTGDTTRKQINCSHFIYLFIYFSYGLKHPIIAAEEKEQQMTYCIWWQPRNEKKKKKKKKKM